MQPSRRIDSRRIAVSIGMVVPALCRKVLPPRRLRKLPHICKSNSTARRRRSNKRAAWRRRTAVVRNPKTDVSSLRVFANVFCRHNARLLFLRWDSGAVDSGTKPSSFHRVHPSVDVRLLLGQHAAAFFHVEENNCPFGEAFASRSGGRSLCVGIPELSGIVL